MGNRTVLRETQCWRPLPSNVYAIVLMMAFTLIPLYLSGCKPEQKELSFDTIDQDDGRWGYYEGKEPRLVVLTGPEEIAVLDQVISLQSVVVARDSGETRLYYEERLQSVDWEACFVVMVFQGTKPNGGYEVTIEHITQQGQRIAVYAEFREPGAGEAVTEIETSPLHAVKVGRNQVVGKAYPFSLVVDGQLLRRVIVIVAHCAAHDGPA